MEKKKKHRLSPPSRKEITEINNPFSALKSLLKITVEPPKGSIWVNMLTPQQRGQPARGAELSSVLACVRSAFPIRFHSGQFWFLCFVSPVRASRAPHFPSSTTVATGSGTLPLPTRVGLWASGICVPTTLPGFGASCSFVIKLSISWPHTCCDEQPWCQPVAWFRHSIRFCVPHCEDVVDPYNTVQLYEVTI